MSVALCRKFFGLGFKQKNKISKLLLAGLISRADSMWLVWRYDGRYGFRRMRCTGCVIRLSFQLPFANKLLGCKGLRVLLQFGIIRNNKESCAYSKDTRPSSLSFLLLSELFS